MRKFVVGMGLVAVIAVPAAAQAQDSKVFFRPTIGAVVGAGPGAAFSGLVSFKANDKTQIFGEGGRMQNILPNKVSDEVERAAALYAASLGGKHSVSSQADASYGMVGFRRAMRDVSGANTFVEVGVGMAHVTSKISATLRGTTTGDISSGVKTAFTTATPENKALVSLGGGFVLGVKKSTAVEVGARYIRIFTDAEAVNMSNIFGGFRFGF
jgi:hypothetical protein